MTDRNTDAREALLPCPFCGGEAVLFGPAESRHWAACGDGDCCGSTVAAEIDEWNTRATPAHDAEPVALRSRYNLATSETGMIINGDYIYALEFHIEMLKLEAEQRNAHPPAALEKAVEALRKISATGWMDFTDDQRGAMMARRHINEIQKIALAALTSQKEGEDA